MEIHTKQLNEIQATYKKTEFNNSKITSSSDGAKVLRGLLPVDINHRECFITLFLDRANNTCGFVIASIGGVSATIVDQKIIFQHALLCNASSMILCHNHPSGNLNPSDADIRMTNTIKEGGKILSIELLDHVILTEDSHFSFADEGII
jgi:DNA repair protein RadC